MGVSDTARFYPQNLQLYIIILVQESPLKLLHYRTVQGLE